MILFAEPQKYLPPTDNLTICLLAQYFAISLITFFNEIKEVHRSQLF